VNKRKLYRSNENRIFFGICGGISEYFGIDAFKVRLGFLILSFISGVGIFGYLIMCIIIPVASNEYKIREKMNVTRSISVIVIAMLIVAGQAAVSNAILAAGAEAGISNLPFVRWGIPPLPVILIVLLLTVIVLLIIERNKNLS